MRYLNPLRYIHYHTQLAIPTIYDESLSFYEIMNKTNLHFNEVINDMNENYEIIDKAFQEVLEQTNKWMEEAKAQADRAEQEANKSQASAEDAKNQADRASSEADAAAASATASQNSAVASANSAKEAADTLDEAKETFVKKTGDTMSGKLTISYGGLSVDGSAGVKGAFNTSRLQVGDPSKKGISYLYGDIVLSGNLTMFVGGNSALAFSDLAEGLKLYAPLSFVNPENISNVANPQEALDAVNKQTLDSEVRSINASLTQVNEKITSLTSRMDTAENNITSITSRVTTNETNISSINNEILNIKQDITTVEGDYVKKAGDTMTGNLTMGLNQIVMDTGHIVGGNNTLLFEGYPLIDVDGAKISMVADPVEAMDAANKEYVDNAVAGVKPTGDYLPLTGGKLSGNLLMGTGTQIDFEEGVHLAYATDFGFGVQTNGGSVGIVSENIVHTDTPITLDSKLITYSISDVSVVPGTTVKQYNCDGTGFQQMRFSGFQNVKFASSLLVDEDPSEAMQVATKQYVDKHAGGGGSKVASSGNYIFVLTPLIGIYSKFEIFVSSTTNVTFKIDGSKIQTQQLQVPYSNFLNDNNLELNLNDSVRYFIQTFKDNTTNSNIALATYFKNILPDTVYFEFTNLSTTHTEGNYSVYGGGKIMECLVTTKQIIA